MQELLVNYSPTFNYDKFKVGRSIRLTKGSLTVDCLVTCYTPKCVTLLYVDTKRGLPKVTETLIYPKQLVEGTIEISLLVKEQLEIEKGVEV